MSFPSKTERNELTRTLKDFAYEHGPMFKDGTIDAMEVRQTYFFTDKVPDGVERVDGLVFDQTKVTLGFYAMRLANDTGRKPIYTFDVSMTAGRLIHPKQMALTDDSWHSLRHEYLDEALEEEIEMDDVIDIEPLSEDEVREEIIDAIIDAGDECEQYQNVMYSFSTFELGIESSYEKGITIAGEGYDIVGTHDQTAYDEGWEVVETVDGETLYVAPKYGGDELSIGDEIEVQQQFVELIRSLGLDDEANENLLVPHEDKMAELVYLIQCMRRRRIDVR